MSLSTLLPDQVLRRTRNLAAHGRLLVGRVTAAMRTLPDFIIIGAQKGGTTSLYAYLSQHPDIARALRKEIHFFNEHYKNGLHWYRSFFPTSAAVDRHLRATGRRLQTGEATPDYLFHPLVPERMHGVLPRAKLIVVLRDPVSRAYSHYQHLRNRGYEPRSFSEAVEGEHNLLLRGHHQTVDDLRNRPRSHLLFGYVPRGFYASGIREWLGFFEMSQFLFLKSEDLFARPLEVLERTERFLGLRPFEWKTSTVFNQGRYDTKIEPAMQRHLQELYVAHNRELAQLLGSDFDWNY
jgi:sulfotransferase family protein